MVIEIPNILKCICIWRYCMGDRSSFIF